MEFWGRAFWGQRAAVNRLTVLAAVLLFCGIGIFGRLVSLQVTQHEKYAALARSQQEHIVEMPAPRGSIFDRNNQPLALSVPVDSVSVNPMQVAESEAVVAEQPHHFAAVSLAACGREQ